MPHVDVRISTSSATLDMAIKVPFTIKLELSLKHDYPITFDNELGGGLFNGRILHMGGLTFTDVASGKRAVRNPIFICTFNGEKTILSEKTQNCFTTLSPNKEYTMTATMVPILHEVGRKPPWENTTSDDAPDEEETVYKVWEWHKTHGLEDGKTYRIGIDDTAEIKEWIQGSKEELLERQASWFGVLGAGWNVLKRGFSRQDASTSQVLDETSGRLPIKFHVIESTEFAMIRPAGLEGLDWPVLPHTLKKYIKK